jgi:dolichol-phosphate mannosyltransferase
MVLIIIPTYNEIENVELMIRTLMNNDALWHVLIIDDASPDGTASRVKALQNEFLNRLHLEIRNEKKGLGTAYIHGFNWGLARAYNYFVEMDCDFSHNPADVIRLIKPCTNGICHLSIGSRYIKDGRITNWPLGRVLMSYFASLYVRIVLGLPIKDTTAGFKCYTRKALQSIDYKSVAFKGYAFQINLKYLVYKTGLQIIEIPIEFTDRERGQSKMSLSIFKEAFFGVFKMRHNYLAK